LPASAEQEISDALDRPRQTVSYQINRAANKLRAMGHCVSLPGRGRRPAREIFVDSRAMNRMRVEDDGEMLTGEWIDSKRTGASNDHSQDD
jgi:hypothetical protein